MQFDIAHIWAGMGTVSRFIAFALVIMAIVSIAVVVERVIMLARSKSATHRFASEAQPLIEAWDADALVQVAERHRRSALARLVGATVRRFERARAEEREANVTAVELARREASRRREAISAGLRQGMPVLASIGSVAPFVGLLGTVVGIITAFTSIASTGSGGLGAVSAGIAEALVETALGLFVAIPAVLFFNYLNTKITSVELALERSAGELIDDMENRDGRQSLDQLKAA